MKSHENDQDTEQRPEVVEKDLESGVETFDTVQSNTVSFDSSESFDQEDNNEEHGDKSQVDDGMEETNNMPVQLGRTRVVQDADTMTMVSIPSNELTLDEHEQEADIPYVQDDEHIVTTDENWREEDAFSAYLAPQEVRKGIMNEEVYATHVRVVPTRKRKKPNKWKAPLILLAVVAAVALGVSLGVTLSRKNKDDSSSRSMSPTPAPTSARFGQVVRLVESISNATSLLDPSTPQYQAVQWMANEDALFQDLDGVDPDRFRQRYVMVLFYFATGGPTSWTNTSFFLKPDVNECEWRDTAIPNTQSSSGYVGVFNCSSNDWVEGIEINQNNLTGTLPQELGTLSSLLILRLSQNSIGGTLPTNLFSLSSLDDLMLWSNEFNGTIPAEIGRATSLRSLSLRANYFTGTIPSEIGSLTSLEQLDSAQKLSHWDDTRDAPAVVHHYMA